MSGGKGAEPGERGGREGVGGEGEEEAWMRVVTSPQRHLNGAIHSAFSILLLLLLLLLLLHSGCCLHTRVGLRYTPGNLICI